MANIKTVENIKNVANSVNLTENQTIQGIKTFSSPINGTINSLDYTFISHGGGTHVSGKDWFAFAYLDLDIENITNIDNGATFLLEQELPNFNTYMLYATVAISGTNKTISSMLRGLINSEILKDKLCMHIIQEESIVHAKLYLKMTHDYEGVACRIISQSERFRATSGWKLCPQTFNPNNGIPLPEDGVIIYPS